VPSGGAGLSRRAVVDEIRDYIRLHLIEDAQRLVASQGVTLAEALDAVAAAKAADPYNFKGRTSESHLCVDCSFNTAPGLLNRDEMEEAQKAQGPADNGVEQYVDDQSEVYMVKPSVWKKAGITPWGGCLCIRCLEKRLGRHLKPKDFLRDHPFNDMPGTERLIRRRGQM